MKALNEIKLPRVAKATDDAARQSEQMNQLRLNQNFKELANAVLSTDETLAAMPEKILQQVTKPKVYVIEVSTDGIWSWRKWSDGLIEAWVTTLDLVRNCTAAAGSLYSAEAEIDLPTRLFATVDAACLSPISTSILSASIKSVSASALTVYLLSPVSANVSVRFGIYLLGK